MKLHAVTKHNSY